MDLNTDKLVNNGAEKVKSSTLRENVLKVMDFYFNDMETNNTVAETILDEVEAAMYEGIMKFTKGNQSRAAKLLGVSRGTLRTKLMTYFGTTHVGGVYRI